MRTCASHCPQLVKYVIDGGGDIHECNEKGETALFYARAPDAIRYLVHCGANVNHDRSHDGSTALLKLCGQYGKVDRDQWTDLVDLDSVRSLIYCGADITVVDDDGRSLLDITKSTRNFNLSGTHNFIKVNYFVRQVGKIDA